MKIKKALGKQSVLFENKVYIMATASVAGKKEGEGPLGNCFDYVEEDPYFGQKTWEKAESKMQEIALELALKKAGLMAEDIGYLVAGDLLGQLIATSFGVARFGIPFFGVYGACSTMGETMAIASMLVESGYAKTTMALTSSHFASAEKQFRFPLDYGNQRPQSATWTVTGSAGVILTSEKTEYNRVSGRKSVVITGITTGKIMDYGIKDSMNMGACMAPAAADVILANLKDFGRKPSDYDKIITGDLGYVGSDILKQLVGKEDVNLDNHMDCGIEIYDNSMQDTHSGGSGCGCSGLVLSSFILRKLCRGDYKRVLFVPTGALLSPVSFNEGDTIPSIAHGIVIEAE